MARVYYVTFNRNAQMTRGRQRVTLEPDELIYLTDRIAVRAVPGRDVADPDRLTAAIDVVYPDRPIIYDVLAVGEIRVLGAYSIYLRSVVTDDGWPAEMIMDVHDLDYSEPDWDAEIRL